MWQADSREVNKYCFIGLRFNKGIVFVYAALFDARCFNASFENIRNVWPLESVPAFYCASDFAGLRN